jgi:hypothetical protein
MIRYLQARLQDDPIDPTETGTVLRLPDANTTTNNNNNNINESDGNSNIKKSNLCLSHSLVPAAPHNNNNIEGTSVESLNGVGNAERIPLVDLDAPFDYNALEDDSLGIDEETLQNRFAGFDSEGGLGGLGSGLSDGVNIGIDNSIITHGLGNEQKDKQNDSFKGANNTMGRMVGWGDWSMDWG